MLGCMKPAAMARSSHDLLEELAQLAQAAEDEFGELKLCTEELGQRIRHLRAMVAVVQKRVDRVDSVDLGKGE
jgi:hypothetical protein